MSEPRTLARSSTIVAVGTALSRATGFLRIAAIAYALGVTTLAGTYSYANEVPNIVYELLLGGVLTATLVPLFVRRFEAHDDEAVSAICTAAIVGLLAITVIGVLIAPWIVELYLLDVHGPGRAQQQELATTLLRLFMPQMLFYGIVTLATAMLNARRRFAAAAFAPILNNVVVIAVFLTLPSLVNGSPTVRDVLDDDALLLLLGLGTTAGIAAVALVLVPAVRAAGVRIRFVAGAWRHQAVHTMLRLSGWTMGYVIANQIALLVVTILANGTNGGPFVYVSAYAFFQLPFGLFVVSLMTTFTPELSSAAARGDTAALRDHLTKGLRYAVVAVVPATALYLALARPLVVLLLQRGNFSSADASLVADTLTAFAVGLVPFSLYLFSLRAFYANHDTFTPFWVNCLENVANIALAFPLYAWLGIPGLALAYGIAYLLAALLTFGVLQRRLDAVDVPALASTLGRALIAGAATALVAWIAAELLGWDSSARALLTIVVSGGVGIATYLGSGALLRIHELSALGTLARGALRRTP